MARKRAAAYDGGYAELLVDKEEEELKASKRRQPRALEQKSQRHKQQRRPPPPSRVTPEQIIANAAAARQKREQRRHHEELPAASAKPPTAATAATTSTVDAGREEEEEDDDDDEDEDVVLATLRRRQAAREQQQREAAGMDEDVAAGDAYEGAFEDEDAANEPESEEGAEDEDGDEEAAAPVVFQCGTCRSVFGDSYAFVGSNAELLLVTLSAVTNITASTEPQTSRDGPDAGSSFQELLCAQCQTVLGRQYVTTPMALDALRGLFSFATTAIASYQLGYPQLQATFADPSSRSAAASRAGSGVDAAVAKALAADRKELLKLRGDMTKVQNLLLVVDERLHHLEDSHEDFVESEGDADDAPPRRR